MSGDKIQCKKCLDVIQSMHRHDFKWCKCGNIFVDGGSAYLRCGYKEGSDFDSAIEFKEENFIQGD